jgi:arylsulfatase A-like enzyme
MQFTLPIAVVVLCALPGCAGLGSRGIGDRPDRPNIIVIMSDDMGFTDVGCYGGEIRTPNLDRLAADGLRFTQFYNTARCCPTRASLLTGLYPHQAGVGHMMDDKGLDGYRGDLNDRCMTVAQVLGRSGYGTYMAGKWHVTRHTWDITDESLKHNWPRQRGFDRYYGTIHGAGSYFDPATLVRDNEYISPFNDPHYQPETYYYTDAISDHAAMFIDDHVSRGDGRPFFLYVAYTAPHWPLHALPQDVEKYRGVYEAGYEPIRRARIEKARKLGVIDSAWEIAPRDSSRDVDSPQWDWEVRTMQAYAAMIDRMDQGIGRIVESLRKSGQLDNTLILYLHDNGGCAEEVGRRPMNPPRTLRVIEAHELQPRYIPPMQTRDGRPVRAGPDVMAGPDDTYLAYGRSWANVSNTPFREYKHWVHEGGIASPLIAHWPKGINDRGALRHDPSHLIDIMATCVELAGAEYPGQTVQPMEGASLTPAFAGRPLERGRPIFFEHEGNRAVRDGRWKLVAKGPAGAWELYDMQTDRTEMRNLAAEHPQRVEQMAAQWQQWAQRSNVLPWPWDKTE